MKKILLILSMVTLFASVAQAKVKTMTCQTFDDAPNVDIRVELGKSSAVVKLIMFGNDVEKIPVDGLATKVTLKEAKALLAGNGMIPFYNEKNDQLWVVLQKHSGTLAIPTGEALTVFTIDNCKGY